MPKALCKNHADPYERFHESFTLAFADMEEQGYSHPHTSYIDRTWNQGILEL